MDIISFDFDEQRREDFIDFPYRLYTGDDNWIPPSKDNLRGRLSADYPFFNHGEAQHFLAYGDDGKVLGRVTANINHRLNIEGKRVGHVGFFECVNDYTTAEALLNASIAHLRERGVDHVWGPVNYATLYEYRFVTKGFDQRTFFSDLYNPPYYPVFFERYGFTPLRKYYTDISVEKTAVVRLYERLRRRFDQQGFYTRRVDLDRWEEELELLYDLLFRTLESNFAFTPMDYDEFLLLYAKYKTLITPEQMVFAYSPKGQAVGFYLAFPDLSGRHPNVFLTKLMGVLPEFVHSGVGMALTHEMYEHVVEQNYDYCILPLRIEGNASRKFGKGLYDGYKEYGLYEYAI